MLNQAHQMMAKSDCMSDATYHAFEVRMYHMRGVPVGMPAACEAGRA